MTVLNETESMKRYTSLNFVEFLDMLCRISIVALDFQDTLEYKTYALLEMIYEQFYKNGELDKDEYPLNQVDEVLR